MPKTLTYTGGDIFEASCAYLSQSPGDMDEVKPFALHWLNALLIEALPYENGRRRYEQDAARPELVAAPRLASLDDAVPYDDDICGLALGYGMASQLNVDDDEDYRAQDFRGRFISALNDTQRLRAEKVVDVYGGEK